MRQEALKRHLSGKSFPITSIKNTGPSGRRLSKMPNLKALIKLVFWAADTSFPTTCKAAKTDSQGNSRSLQLWKQSLLCCGLQEFLGDLSFLNTSLSNKKWWSAMDGSNFFSFTPFSSDSSSPSCLTESKWPTQNQKVNQLEPTNRTTSTYCPSHRTCLSIPYITCPQSLFPHYVQHSSPLSQALGRKTVENSFNASSTQPAQLQSVFQACTSGAVNTVHRLIQVWKNLRRFLGQPPAQLEHVTIHTIFSVHLFHSQR